MGGYVGVLVLSGGLKICCAKFTIYTLNFRFGVSGFQDKVEGSSVSVVWFEASSS